ncbi:MAG: Rpn family recombination-promoting nuclease/putative transposase [Bacteroidota bacterium]
MHFLSKPFDLLFKHTLGSDVAIQDLVRYHMPAVYKRIDKGSIKPIKQSFVPANLRELHSDLVCSCTINGQAALLYILIEHQSTGSWLMPLRFIKYKIAAIEHFLQGKPAGTPWPIVICACFYHGQTSPYPYPTNVHDYFTDPALARELGVFERFQLIDLTVMGDEELQRHGTVALMEQILKHSRERDFYNLIEELLLTYRDTLLSLESPLGPDYWHAVYLVVHRIFELQGHSTQEAAALFAEKLNLSKTKEDIMTVTQAIKQEGIEEGLQQGRQQGLQQGRQQGMQQGRQQGIQTRTLEIAKTMLLHLHLSTDVVQQATGLSRAVLKQLAEDTAAY